MSTYFKNFEESRDSEDSYQGDDPDAYYIMFRKPDELMPPSCVYNRLDRADADRYTYFILIEYRSYVYRVVVSSLSACDWYFIEKNAIKREQKLFVKDFGKAAYFLGLIHYSLYCVLHIAI